VGCCENGNEPRGSVNVGMFSSSVGTISFSRVTVLHGVNWLSYRTVLARSFAFV
jgi:hypothetical protein